MTDAPGRRTKPPSQQQDSQPPRTLASLMVGSRRRRITTAAMAIGGVVLAWLIVGTVTTPPQPEKALDGSGNPATTRVPSLMAAADAELTRKPEDIDWARVQAASRAALAADPLTERALGLYGLSLDAHDQPVTARTAMEMGAARSLRDPVPHVWLYDNALQRGDYAGAIAHADVVIRARPELRYTLYDSMRQLVVLPDAVQALSTALARNPPWRTEFLLRASDNPPSLGGTTALFAELQRTPSPPTNRELGQLLTKLVDGGKFQDALFLWLSVLPSDQFATLDYLSNGDFRFPLSGLPFDWSIKPVEGADITIEATAGAEEALRVQFYRGRVDFQNVSKLLTLPPGKYKLQGREKADAFDTERGTVWRVYCAGPTPRILGASDPLRGTTDWKTFEADIDVPADNCPAQWLRLEIDARVALEKDVNGGSIWFDDLSITRAEPAATN
ncbi:hypothetical protein AB7M35_002816 [Amorphus suaedae]